MDTVIYILSALTLFLGAYVSGKYLLHMAQLEGYKPKQYWWWIKHNLRGLFFKEGLSFLAVAAILAVFRETVHFVWSNTAALILWLGANAWIISLAVKVKREAKKPLVFTHRAIRLFIIYFILTGLSALGSSAISSSPIVFMALLALSRALLPIVMLLAAAVAYPIEMAIQYRYFREAQIKIRAMKNLKVIGITGSYGKTSTKYFLKTILDEKYNTLMTPESYNTPMGITRVIREQLKDEHQVFVCEMGARNVGDIKTLCRLAGPTMGIITSIGPQHLETFKSIENVAKTKYELIDELPYDGTAIFNGDNEYCMELARKTGIETFIYGIKERGEDVYLYAEEIKVTKNGLKFRVKGKDGIDFECSTCLLGKHNVSNMLGAICAALKLGLTPSEIQKGISKIKPVPHRLEILPTNNGVTVIDDAFNSNPVGAREALETIRDIGEGSRIVVTPGMVELGAVEYEENKKFGKAMAGCVDYAILVGIKRSKPIVEGLKEENFPEDRIIVTSNLSEATVKLGQIVKSGDVVLFENDLPDNYNE